MIKKTRKFYFNETHDEVDTEGSWAISYGDMITLLLTFFIVFFTIEPKKDNTKQVMKLSMLKAINEADEDIKASAEMNLGDTSEAGIDTEALKKLQGVAHDRGQQVIVEFPGVSFFGEAQIDVTRGGAMALQKFVSAYIPYAGNFTVSIRAFADPRKVVERPGRRFKDNLELTALRSVATMRVLQKAGLPLSRIKLSGYGELTVTARELANITKETRRPSSEFDYARKVVLVIEPEVL